MIIDGPCPTRALPGIRLEPGQIRTVLPAPAPPGLRMEDRREPRQPLPSGSERHGPPDSPICHSRCPAYKRTIHVSARQAPASPIATGRSRHPRFQFHPGSFVAGESLYLSGKLRRPHALGAFAQDQYPSSRLHDVLGRSEPLDGLVKRQVQGMAGGAGDDGVRQSGEALQRSRA